MRVPARRESEVAAQRRRTQPPPHPLLALQQSAGNQAVVRHLARFAEPEPDVEQVMEQLARGRQTLFASMRHAPNEKERRQRTMALRAFDAPFLAKLRVLGTGKQHPNPAVQDMVLAALQLQAIGTAEGALRNPKDAKAKAHAAAGMPEDNWCGFFAVDKFIESGLDKELKAGYFHVANVYDYFTYDYDEGDGSRIKKWIYAEDEWHELRDYHRARGAERKWMTAEDIECLDQPDIRPGDIALLDHKGGSRGDHIMMVHSYDPRARRLFTIGGNDLGLQLDARRGEHAPRNEAEGRMEDATDTPLRRWREGDPNVGVRSHVLAGQPTDAEAAARTDVGDLKRIAAIGRPSIVDFENHRYDGTSLEFPPATKPK